MEKRSVGLIETWGFVPAVEAADAGAKAASVEMPGLDVVPVGRVVVRFFGDVAAVSAAVRAGAAAAERVGKVISTHVIARPDLRIKPCLQPPPFSSYWPPFSSTAPPSRLTQAEESPQEEQDVQNPMNSQAVHGEEWASASEGSEQAMEASHLEKPSRKRSPDPTQRRRRRKKGSS